MSHDLALMYQETARRMAGLPGVGEATRDVEPSRLLQVAIGQHDVRRLAAQFQTHALHGLCRRLADTDARLGRSGERNEVHIGVARHRFAHDTAAANDQVEDAWRRPRLVHHLGQRHARDGRCIRWLQHHGAARCDAVDHLHDGLLHRPVPRRDQRADADRLAANNRVGQLALEVIVAEHVASDSHVSWRTGHLRGERDRHPDLLRDQLRELVLATLIGGDDPINQGDPLFDRRLRVGCESTLCRGDRAVNIGHRPPRRDCCPRLLARRIDQRPRALAAGVDPGAIDVQLSIMFHVMPPQNETSMAPMTSPRQLADRAVLEHLLSDHSTDTTGEQE